MGRRFAQGRHLHPGQRQPRPSGRRPDNQRPSAHPLGFADGGFGGCPCCRETREESVSRQEHALGKIVRRGRGRCSERRLLPSPAFRWPCRHPRDSSLVRPARHRDACRALAGVAAEHGLLAGGAAGWRARGHWSGLRGFFACGRRPLGGRGRFRGRHGRRRRWRLIGDVQQQRGPGRVMSMVACFAQTTQPSSHSTENKLMTADNTRSILYR
mmetsp:Transcript_104813/g.205584  ORF Transcript_104813/g.205584 Transcript_104813/m.205584 type:complete len:213 (-) Transcript_104813:178-816(-)